MRRLVFMLAAVLLAAVLAPREARCDIFGPQCDIYAKTDEAIGLLLDLGYPPPIAPDGSDVEISWEFSDPTTGNSSRAAKTSKDKTKITLYWSGIDVFFEKWPAHCDIFVLAVVLLHEYQHCGGGFYPGYNSDVCGEWKAHKKSFDMLCLILDTFQTDPNGPDVETLCAGVCQEIGWFKSKVKAAISAACTGFSATPPDECHPCNCP